MAVLVTHTGAIVDKVPAMDVVVKAVIVIVGVLGTLSLKRVGPDVGRQVGVLDIHTRVDDGDNGTLGRDFIHSPQLRQVDGGETILFGVIRLLHIGLVVSAHDELQVVGLGKFDLRQRLELLNCISYTLQILLGKLEAVKFAHVALDHGCMPSCDGADP